MKRTTKILLSSVSTLLVLVAFGGIAFADDAQTKLSGLASNYGLIAIAAGFGLGLAAFGGGIGQGRAAAAALDGIARNPGAAGQIRGPMILGLALIESLVIYALIIAFILAFKVGA